MSTPLLHSTAGLRRMAPRDPDEGHRAASSLELFFDLVFVVAVGAAASDLHHIEAAGHVVPAVTGYALVFFSIWWAWMNFTWFATSFDTDDWLYRVTTIVQMAGVLVLAAGVHSAMTESDFRIVVVGYVIMRLAMVGQWSRAAVSSPAFRTVARRYAIGIAVVQLLWVLWGTVPSLSIPWVAPVLVLCELAVPPIAERDQSTPWHAGHIAERFGLFTLIVLGEGLVASTNAVVDGIGHVEHLAPLLVLAAAGLVITAGLWWVYFSREQQDAIAGLRSSLVFGYGHWFVFAAAAALPAGIEVAVAAEAGEADLSHVSVAATVAVPVGLFVLAVQALSLRHGLDRRGNTAVTVLALAMVATVVVPSASLVLVALLVAAVVVVLEVTGRAEQARPPADR